VNTILGDDVAEEFGLLLHKGTLAELCIETVLAKKSEDAADVTQMLGFGARVDENVIKIHNNPFVKSGI
jgi:hypothetical protein